MWSVGCVFGEMLINKVVFPARGTGRNQEPKVACLCMYVCMCVCSCWRGDKGIHGESMPLCLRCLHALAQNIDQLKYIWDSIGGWDDQSWPGHKRLKYWAMMEGSLQPMSK